MTSGLRSSVSSCSPCDDFLDWSLTFRKEMLLSHSSKGWTSVHIKKLVTGHRNRLIKVLQKNKINQYVRHIYIYIYIYLYIYIYIYIYIFASWRSKRTVMIQSDNQHLRTKEADSVNLSPRTEVFFNQAGRKQKVEILPNHTIFSIQILSRLDSAYPCWGRGSTLLSPPIQMPISFSMLLKD
jgi:hypothetical protein